MSYRHVPSTPTSSVPSRNFFAPLTPHTPAPVISRQNMFEDASLANLQTPNAKKPSFTSVYTPPDSESRHVSKAQHRSAVPKSLTLESWRKPIKNDLQHDQPVFVHDDGLLPPALISTSRRTDFDSSVPMSIPVAPNNHMLHREPLAATPRFETGPENPLSHPTRTKGTTLDHSAALDKVNMISKDSNVSDVERLECIACAVSRSDLVMLSCSHSLCSSCFTASLNIVGEKEFSCVLCSEPVLDFRFLSSKGSSVGDISSKLASLEISKPSLPSDDAFLDPIAQSSSSELSVLRLDDVPWDVTPFMLSSWANIPTLQAHVLLDCDGKTLSHAYIEASADMSRKILLNCRNKVLGSGKRARRVTITASSQDELMQQLFLSWGGTFENASPTLSNVSEGQVSAVMSMGLLATSDIDRMGKLIFHPDSRYVKDPSLPFHALISVINKFPTGGDSRVFWNYVIRDSLFSLIYSAAMLLVSSDDTDWKMKTVTCLIDAFLKCPIFTADQMDQVYGFLDTEHLSSDSSLISTPPSKSLEPAPTIYIPQNHHVDCWSPYNSIALEFGLEPHVVQAVYERLSYSFFV